MRGDVWGWLEVRRKGVGKQLPTTLKKWWRPGCRNFKEWKLWGANYSGEGAWGEWNTPGWQYRPDTSYPWRQQNWLPPCPCHCLGALKMLLEKFTIFLIVCPLGDNTLVPLPSQKRNLQSHCVFERGEGMGGGKNFQPLSRTGWNPSCRNFEEWNMGVGWTRVGKGKMRRVKEITGVGIYKTVINNKKGTTSNLFIFQLWLWSQGLWERQASFMY